MIEVISAGTQTSVQDLGREGWRAHGIGPAGAMDRWAARIANGMLGNAEDAAVIEMALRGPELHVHDATWCAVSGADFGATLDDAPLPLDRPVWLPAGARLRFASPRAGCRAVLALRGGVDVPLAFGSRATDARAGIGGVAGRLLQRGDRLQTHESSASPRRVAWWSALAAAAQPGDEPFALIPSETWSRLAADDRARLLVDGVHIGRAADRMGLRLEESLPSARDLPAIVTQAVCHGAVQLPPDGRAILLGADHQATGGYPLLGAIAGIDHTRLAQLRSGDALRFRLVTVTEAQAAWRAREQRFRRWQARVAAWWRETET